MKWIEKFIDSTAYAFLMMLLMLIGALILALPARAICRLIWGKSYLEVEEDVRTEYPRARLHLIPRTC
jgi:hypothetical protein